MADSGILIVGTGQAAYQVASSLRDEGYDGAIRLVGDEPHLPYQRPPLSKSFMTGDVEAPALTFQGDGHFDKHRIELVRGVRVTRIVRGERFVETDAGGRLDYEHLVLATGARNRSLPCIPGPLKGVFALRGLDDALAMRTHLSNVKRVVVIGAGFLGLEFAAVAAGKGIAVTVIEAGASLMGRVVSAPVAAAFQEHHAALGTRFRLGTTITRVHAVDGHVVSVETADADVIEADMAVVSIGVMPNSELAQEAGLTTANGIVVDARLATDDPAISALGDCAAFPSRFAPGHCRIESIQNAMDQARFLAKRLAATVPLDAIYDAVPWFWSDQGGLKLQIAGLSHGVDEIVLRGDRAGLKFSAYGFRQGRLVTVESVARPADHMAARRLLTANAPVTPALAADETVDLKSLLATPAPPAAHA